MIKVRNGVIYREENGEKKQLSVKELPLFLNEEFEDENLKKAVIESQRKGKPLVVADAGERKGIGKRYVILNSTYEAISKIKDGDYFVGSFGFSGKSYLYYVRFFSYLGSDLRRKFDREFVVYETSNLKKNLKIFKRKVELAESPEITPAEEKDLKSTVKSLGGSLIPELMPHQKKFLYLAIKRTTELRKKGKEIGLFLADDMGLGKTIQALAFAKAVKGFPIVIVCPKSAADVWAGEVKEWLGLEAKVYTTKDKGFDKSYLVHVIPVSLFSLKRFGDNLPFFFKERVKTFIIDESHMLKNYRANRTKAVKRLIRELRKNYKDMTVLALSGTPQTVSPLDYLSQLDLIGFLANEDVNWGDFIKRYVKVKVLKVTNSKGEEVEVETPVGTKHPYELNLWLKSTVMIKRERDKALKNLPEKGVLVDRVPLLNRLEYQKRLKKFKENPHKYQELREWLSLHKIPYTLKLVREALEQGSKVVVLAHYRKTQEVLKKELEKTVKEFGGELVYFSPNTAKKGEAVKKFQEDKNCLVFLGSFQSAKQSLTLTAADTLIIHDVPSVYADKVQAEQRIHRIGQTKNVLVIYPVLKKTVEEEILKLLNTRKEEADKLLSSPERVWQTVFGNGDDDPKL